MTLPRKTGADAGEDIVIGAGPGGLAAAWEWVTHGKQPVVFEMGPVVGGIARTENYRGYHFDVGGHRFYSKLPGIEALWRDMLGDELLEVNRLSRIYFRGDYFPYPLRAGPTLRKLGLIHSSRILLSWLRCKIAPSREEETFEQYVTNRFGRELYETFFRSYTEKIWGMSCQEISADWAAQRIQGLSLTSALKGAFGGGSNVRSLTSTFLYPRLGPGLMWARFAERIEAAGGTVELESEVKEIRHHGDLVTQVVVARKGVNRTFAVKNCVSSLPLPHLVQRMTPEPPSNVVQAAKALRFRDFIMVGLIVKRPNLFPDQWIYIHAPEFQVGRIQNFGNWSPEMVPAEGTSSLGLEYFCNQQDEVWKLSSAELIQLASKEAVGLGLIEASEIQDAIVIRQSKAYPVYDQSYREHVATIRRYLSTFSNLSTIGRNGLHRYNNQDHSMLSGQRVVRNHFGENHDVWQVNEAEDYLEVSMNRE